MAHEQLVIEIEGQELSTLYADLLHLEVELDEELAALFRVRLSLTPQPDGSWPYIDDTQLVLWQKVTIRAGFDNTVDLLISGHITHLRPSFPPDSTGAVLELWGMDGSVLLDRVEVRKAWPNKKDSDIAAELLQRYGFTPAVTDTRIVHDEAISTVIQCESDMQFLKRLALRNGYECFIEGETGYFRPPQLDGPPQPSLAVHFGDETNVRRLTLEVNALTAVNVAMSQLDRREKQVLETSSERSQLPTLGATNASQLLRPGITAGQIYLRHSVTTGLPEMTALSQSLFHTADWFVTGEGEILANDYGHVLKPRQTVTIKGIGERYSGVYYVSRVVHTFTPEGYTQTFAVKRNALQPTGTEPFGGGSAGLLGGLG